MRSAIIAVCCALSAGISAAFEVDFSGMEFLNGIPNGWSEAENLASGKNISFSTPSTFDKKKVFTVNLYNAGSNATRVVYCNDPVENVICDNISARVWLYCKKDQADKVDKLQVVVSTHGFSP